MRVVLDAFVSCQFAFVGESNRYGRNGQELCPGCRGQVKFADLHCQGQIIFPEKVASTCEPSTITPDYLDLDVTGEEVDVIVHGYECHRRLSAITLIGPPRSHPRDNCRSQGFGGVLAGLSTASGRLPRGNRRNAGGNRREGCRDGGDNAPRVRSLLCADEHSTERSRYESCHDSRVDNDP